ncbi:hypothetical protein NIES39_E01080 [Arthrospira platensis NIES-39]|nr:hypothetical protein NIES39_E01080 [Arthrospira platensis NIES-39]
MRDQPREKPANYIHPPAGARSATGKTSQLYTPARGCAISHGKNQPTIYTRPRVRDQPREKPANYIHPPAGARSATGKTSQLYTPARGCAISHGKNQPTIYTRPRVRDQPREKPANYIHPPAGARSATGKTSQLYTPARGCAISHGKNQPTIYTRPRVRDQPREKPANYIHPPAGARSAIGNTSTTRTQTMPWQRNAQRPSEQRKNQPTPYTNY